MPLLTQTLQQQLGHLVLGLRKSVRHDLDQRGVALWQNHAELIEQTAQRIALHDAKFQQLGAETMQ
ncbi:hypothetical protein D9M73_197950 [compost metagenome]